MITARAIVLTSIFSTIPAALASDNKHTISIGYAQTHVSGSLKDKYLGEKLPFSLGSIFFPETNRLGGVNVKYRYEIDDMYGVITSFTTTSSSTEVGRNKKSIDYYSLSAGPSLRFNEYISIYGTLGLARAKYSLNTPNTKVDSYAPGLSGTLGTQVNVTKNVVIDASYELSKVKFKNDIDGKFGTWSVGVGYKF